jgi:tetratricopeptide (TPR) repeat protein
VESSPASSTQAPVDHPEQASIQQPQAPKLPVPQPATAQQDEAAALEKRVGELNRAGKFSEAIPLAQRVLAIRENALGPDHPYVAGSLNWLASLYQDQGRYATAEPLYKRSLAIREKALGPDHPDVAQSLTSLASLYQAHSATPTPSRSTVSPRKAAGSSGVSGANPGWRFDRKPDQKLKERFCAARPPNRLKASQRPELGWPLQRTAQLS